jgi:molybdopterin converting factor small subunit
LADWLPRCAIGVNGEYAENQTAIPAGAEIAVLPPVSGGS